MKLTITMTQPKSRKKPKKVETTLPDSTTLETLRKLWEMEQLLNNLNIDLHVHVGIEH